MKIRNSLLLATFLLLFEVGTAWAVSIAVMPVEDLSQGRNGVNDEVTSYLASELGKKGMFVIPQEDIMSFMAHNRIRWVGQLNSYHISQARDELGVDLILLGTVTQKATKPSITLGVTLYLIRTDDGQNIWSNSSGLNLDDLRRILGISEPETLDELLPLVANNALEGWPENLNAAMGKLPVLEIETAFLQPKYVRPGQLVNCAIKLRSDWPVGDEPKVLIKIGDREQRQMTAAPNQNYESSWSGQGEDGRYPVSVLLLWPSGRKKESYIGSYFVDSQPPRITLDLKGKQVHGSLAFRDKIVLIPRMLRREQLSNWRISIKNEAGQEVRKEDGQGNMPPSFTWNGNDRKSQQTEEGYYQAVLEAWDLAQNLSTTTSEKIFFSRTPPAMILEAKRSDQEMHVDLQHEGKTPLAFWKLEMRNYKGELLKIVQGDNLPVQLNLPLSVASISEGIKCQVIMEDVLGNKTKNNVVDLVELTKPKEVMAETSSGEKKFEQDKWVAEF